MYLPVILGTAREGRRSEMVASYMEKKIRELSDLETEVLDVRNFRVSATTRDKEKEVVKRFKKHIDKADGLIIVSPEYNHGYPGELKMMIDMLYKEYNQKPIGFCAVSASFVGGARMVEQFKQVAIELQMTPIRESLFFPTVQNLFDDEGNIKDHDSYDKKVKSFLDQLLFYANHLKEARK